MYLIRRFVIKLSNGSVINHFFYLYPVMLLFASTVGNIFNLFDKPGKQRKFINLILIVGLIGLTAFNVKSGFQVYQNKLETIKEHPSLIFYKKISGLGILSGKQNLKVLHTAFIYLPDSLKVEHVVPYELITLALIEKEKPGIIIFERETGIKITDASYQKNYMDPEKAKVSALFYHKALIDSLPDYSMIVSDNFGVALKKNGSITFKKSGC